MEQLADGGEDDELDSEGERPRKKHPSGGNPCHRTSTPQAIEKAYFFPSGTFSITSGNLSVSCESSNLLYARQQVVKAFKQFRMRPGALGLRPEVR